MKKFGGVSIKFLVYVLYILLLDVFFSIYLVIVGREM